MNDQKQSNQKDEVPKTLIGTEGPITLSKASKNWIAPVVFSAAAVVVFAGAWSYHEFAGQKPAASGSGITTSTSATQEGDAVTVNAKTETMQWPVKDHNTITVAIPFYDTNATSEEKQAALIEYNNTFTPNTGIDLVAKDKQAFDVLAALSGKVTAVGDDPVVGKLVEITSSNGLVTIYQSLDNVKVTKGADIKKGDVIASAGLNDLGKAEGVHLHFEVRQDGNAVNPDQFLSAK